MILGAGEAIRTWRWGLWRGPRGGGRSAGVVDGWLDDCAGRVGCGRSCRARRSAGVVDGRADERAKRARVGHGVGIPPTTGNFTWRDDFKTSVLKPEWLQVRVPKQPWADLNTRPGWLTDSSSTRVARQLEKSQPPGRRQQHTAFDASTELEAPAAAGVALGLAAFQSENAWYFLGSVGNSGLEIFLEKRGGTRTADHCPCRARRREPAEAENRRQRSRVFLLFRHGRLGWKPLKDNDDGSILSTDVAGGFVGTTVGPYARLETGQ